MALLVGTALHATGMSPHGPFGPLGTTAPAAAARACQTRRSAGPRDAKTDNPRPSERRAIMRRRRSRTARRRPMTTAPGPIPVGLVKPRAADPSAPDGADPTYHPVDIAGQGAAHGLTARSRARCL